MAKTIEQIQEEVQQIKNETVAKQNTATRVGGALEDMVEKMEADSISVEGKLSNLGSKVGELSELETTDKTNVVKAINEALTKGGIPDAPSDGKQYVRQNNAWAENKPAVDAYSKTESDAKFAQKSVIAEEIAKQDKDIADFKSAVTDQVNNYKPIVINGDVTNAQDEEDLTAIDGLLKLKDRSALDGMGYVILRKNKTFAEQVTKANTIYEIRYEFEVGGTETEPVVIPENCVLKFEGGKLSNGTIKGNETKIICSNQAFVNNDYSGSWLGNPQISWFGGESDDDRVSEGMKMATVSNRRTLDLCNEKLDLHCIEMTDDKFCSLSNAVITFHPIKDGDSAIFFNGTKQYTLGGVSLDNISFTCVEQNYKQVSGILAYNLYNTSGWVWKNLRFSGFTGYAIVNCGYLQEGFLDNIRMNSVGGFLSYNSDLTYKSTIGSSNIIKISNCSIDNRLNPNTKTEDVPNVIDIVAGGMIDFEKCVFQGASITADSVPRKGMEIRPGSALALYPIINLDCWFEFTSNGNVTNRVYQNSFTKIYIIGRTPNLDICGDYAVTDISKARIQANDFLAWIRVPEEITKYKLFIDGTNIRKDKYGLYNLLSFIKRGFIDDIRSGGGNYSTHDFYLRISKNAETHNMFDSFILDIPDANFGILNSLESADGVPIMTFKNSSISKNPYRQIFFFYPSVLPMNNMMTFYVIYRYRNTSGAPSTINIYTPGNTASRYIYIDSDGTESGEWSSWTEKLGQRDILPDKGCGAFVRIDGGAELQIACFYVGLQGIDLNKVETWLGRDGKLKTEKPVYTLRCRSTLTNVQSNLDRIKKLPSTLLNIGGDYFTIPEDGTLNPLNTKISSSLTTGTEIADINGTKLYAPTSAGDTRPTLAATNAGYQFFDTTLNKPIYWTGSKWVDATGADV